MNAVDKAHSPAITNGFLANSQPDCIALPALGLSLVHSDGLSPTGRAKQPNEIAVVSVSNGCEPCSVAAPARRVVRRWSAQALGEFPHKEPTDGDNRQRCPRDNIFCRLVTNS